jgi:hypothetical protein
MLYKRAEAVSTPVLLIYTCPSWEFAADTHLLKFQRLQNRVLRTIGNFPWRIPVRESHKAFSIPYVYDYMTKLSRQQAEVIQIHEYWTRRSPAQKIQEA